MPSSHVDTNNKKETEETMTEDAKKTEGCKHAECAMSWLKVVDDWTVAGYKNRLPRLYYAVIGLVILVMIM